MKFVCQRINDEQLEELRRAAGSFEDAVRSEDLTRLAEADVDFHDLIYKATGNERLVQLLNNIREQMYRYRVEYLKDEEIRSSLIQEHNQLWQALKDRDEKKAARITQEHIERQQEYILDNIMGSEKKSE